MSTLILKRTSPLALVFLTSVNLLAQKQPKDRPLPPAAMSPQVFLVLDSVVTEQWPAMAGTAANPPAEIKLLNPGQCVRAGVIAMGAGHEHFLDGLSIEFTVTQSGKPQTFPAQPAFAYRLMKPEGGDFVTGALAAAGIKNPMETTGVLAVSSAKWCVPLDAAESLAKFNTDATLNGKTIHLKEAGVQIEEIKTAAAKGFKDKQEMGQWMTEYHLHPEPGRLLALVKFIASDSLDANSLEFLKAAFAHDAATVRAFGPAIDAMEKHPRTMVMFALSKANVALDHPPVLDNDEREFLRATPDLSDPYDWKPGAQLWNNLDLLWADFIATGHKQPIAAITAALAWKDDYDAFAAMQKRGEKPKELTDPIIHALTYSAAGWSLSSFDRNDPLAADYIQAIRADPKTSPQVRTALETLYTDPAFKQSH